MLTCASYRHVFYFHHTQAPKLIPLSLHDALPIFPARAMGASSRIAGATEMPEQHTPSVIPVLVTGIHHAASSSACGWLDPGHERSEEHTSELQSRENLVCRLLLEKKKKPQIIIAG